MLLNHRVSQRKILARLSIDFLAIFGPAPVNRFPIFLGRRRVFRAAVERDGVPVSDILQVWLDVSNHPGRVKDQANLLRRRVLSQILDKNQA